MGNKTNWPFRLCSVFTFFSMNWKQTPFLAILCGIRNDQGRQSIYILSHLFHSLKQDTCEAWIPLFPMVHHHWSCYLAKPLASVVFHYYSHKWGFPGGSDGKESAAMQETWVWFLGQEDPLEKRMATHFSILAWRFSWTEEPGGLCVCVCVCVCMCVCV